MKTKRAHILLPQDLVREIDAMVGPRGRSAFLVETAREAIRRKRLLQFLESDEPIGKGDETEEDSASWVRELRRESDRRIPKKRSAKNR